MSVPSHPAFPHLVEAYAAIEIAKLALDRAQRAGQIGLISARHLSHCQLELSSAGLGITNLQIACSLLPPGADL